MNKIKIHIVVLAFFSGFILFGCANIGGISGGDKDVTPPKMLGGKPLNKSLNFKGKEIEIEFDEFLELKDVDRQLVISPPGLEKPEVKLKGKKILVKFNEDLLPNTTYTLYFGNAITDLNEGNPVSNFEYVFSTGSTLDSAVIQGKIIDAFKGNEEKEAWVFLYETSVDSPLVKQKPYFVTKSREDGSFLFSHLPQRKFLMFGLKDVNSNYLYDGQGEEVAFYDKEIMPSETRLDTSRKSGTDYYYLKLFTEIDSVQQLRSTAMPEPGKIVVSFAFPVENLSWEFISPRMKKSDYITALNSTRDSLTFWMKSDTLFKAKIKFTENRKLNDTASFSYVSNLGKNQKNKALRSLDVSSNLRSSFPYYLKPVIRFSRPVRTLDTLCVLLLGEKDTVKSSLVFFDSLKLRAALDYPLSENSTYTIKIADSVATDIYGYKNDSVYFQFRTTKSEDYGALRMIIVSDSLNFPFLIELQTDKGTSVETVYVDKPQQISFKYLLPGEYLLKCIFDKNRNKRWDSGVLSKKIQPERTIIYSGKLTIRANWDLDERWHIE